MAVSWPGLQNPIHRSAEPMPLILFGFQLSATLPGKSVEFGLSVVL
jgi:hypothetical protein